MSVFREEKLINKLRDYNLHSSVIKSRTKVDFELFLDHPAEAFKYREVCLDIGLHLMEASLEGLLEECEKFMA